MESKVGDIVERYRKKTMETGQAMVEWALVFPVFLLLVFGIIDFSWLGYQQLMFESSFQMTAWDFTLNLGGLTENDILVRTTPPDYHTFSPVNAVKVSGRDYALGEGIKKHILQSAAGFLEEDKLTVTRASAVFEVEPLKDTYKAGGVDIYLESYELQVNLEGDLQYRVTLLTPVGRIFNSSGEVVIKKKLARKRTERVAVKRQVAIPASS